jgi:hypothetical protein
MRFTLFIAACLSLSSFFAQEATITYDVVLNTEDDNVQNKTDLMGGSKMVLTYASEQLKEEEFWGENMAAATHVYDEKAQQGLLFLNGPTGKLGAIFDFDQLDNRTYEIEYTEEVKEIAGYTCKKAIILQGDIEIIYWYTEELEMPKARSKYIYKDIQGVPLHIIRSTGEMVFEYTVSTISLDVSQEKGFFQIVMPEEYSEQPYEELKEILID